jgi:hypothetical protein
MKIVTNRPSFQGDVMLQRIDSLPRDVVETQPQGGHYIVAHSETGHHHVIEARPGVKMYKRANDAYEAFLQIVAGQSTLEHKRGFDTHEPLALPPGTYRVKRQREYIPEGFRRAAD